MMLKSSLSGKGVQVSGTRRVQMPAKLRFVAVAASKTEEETQALSFTNNSRAAEGYMEKDSAGQTNMFPSVMRPYEAGSAADSGNSGVVVGLGAGAVAAAAIALGLSLLAKGPVVAEADASLQPLSLYATKFSSELGLKPAAAVVAPAPAVAAEEVVAEEVAAEEVAAPEA